MIKKLKSGQGPTEGCRAIDRQIDSIPTVASVYVLEYMMMA
jgi:hypothetical protein